MMQHRVFNQTKSDMEASIAEAKRFSSNEGLYHCHKARFATETLGSLPSTHAAGPLTLSMVLSETVPQNGNGDDYSDKSSVCSFDSDAEEPKQEVSALTFRNLGACAPRSESASTDKGNRSSRAPSVACLSDVASDDGEEFQAPLLNIEDGLRPRNSNDLPTCPPNIWLRLAGFEVSSGPAFAAVPRPVVAGEQPTRYLDLFSRRLVARERQSPLTVAALKQHDRRMGVVRHDDPFPGAVDQSTPASEWLFSFLAQARATPLAEVATSLMGFDLAENVARYLDSLSDTSSTPAELFEEDIPDGTHVTGRRVLVRPVHQGNGRRGFEMRDDISVSTPGRSQSPPPDRSAGTNSYRDAAGERRSPIVR